MTIKGLMGMSMNPIARLIKRLYLGFVARHYEICADVECEKAKESSRNCSYYQRKAALARSEQQGLKR